MSGATISQWAHVSAAEGLIFGLLSCFYADDPAWEHCVFVSAGEIFLSFIDMNESSIQRV